MSRKIFFVGLFLFQYFVMINAQTEVCARNLFWHKNESKDVFTFHNSVYLDAKVDLPFYFEVFQGRNISSVKLKNIISEKVELNDINLVRYITSLNNGGVKINLGKGLNRGEIQSTISFLPFYVNENQIYRIKSFEIDYTIEAALKANQSEDYLSHSVLSAGKWYKIKVNKEGIFKLTYTQIKNMGFSDPSKIRIYGNGGAMLPRKITVKRDDDLVENAIYFEKGSDGVFNTGDYVLFYAQGSTTWRYDEKNKIFKHQLNDFTDFNYYFITDYLGAGKNISDRENVPANGAVEVFTYDDYGFHEKEIFNILGSGRQWLGEKLSNNDFVENIDFQDIDIDSGVIFYYNVAAASSEVSRFKIAINNKEFQTNDIGSIDRSDKELDNARQTSGLISTKVSGSKITVKFHYLYTTDNEAEGYIDYYGINVRRNLIYRKGPMFFRDKSLFGSGSKALYKIQGASGNITIWDITDIHNPSKINYSLDNGVASFVAQTDKISTYVIFEKNDISSVPLIEGEDIGLIENQNLHGMQVPDMLIVVPKDSAILPWADTLADFRRKNDGLEVAVVRLDKVFNEFSSGKRDVTAIRDFVRLLYNKDEKLKFLLLFGDGTFDNRNYNVKNNTNLIPTYQSEESFNKSFSYVSDDYFGWLDDTISDPLSLLDIGVGRLPVKNYDEASAIVKKIINYANPKTMGDWRNNICFIADDEDNSLHMGHASVLADSVRVKYPDLRVYKILLDAYMQESSSLGERYPDANKAVDTRLSKGSLFVNYTGHGSITQLTTENVIDIPSIRAWNNFDKLTIFVTGTCDFSKFDDVIVNQAGDNYEVRTSGGEEVVLNPNGGGVAIIGTTRIVYSGENYELNSNFYKNIFNKDNGKPIRLGEIVRLTKNTTSASTNKLNFTLLGDPSIMIAFPHQRDIRTDSIVNSISSIKVDTVKALSMIKINGHIPAREDFNGKIFVSLLDKPKLKSTLNNDGQGVYKYYSQENSLFQGEASIINGKFSIECAIPKDIDYKVGTGKIVYYAHNDLEDISGYDKNLLIGGLNTDIELDSNGPQVKVYVNDTNFTTKGICSSNAKLYVTLFDENGINASGNGIGHDIVGVIDNDYVNQLILNDYYQSVADNFRIGKVVFPMLNLEPGVHTITVTAWDTQNNSGSASTEFVVLADNDFVTRKVSNYPNPFTDYTMFTFEHNRPDDELTVDIQIYDLTGQQVIKLSGKNKTTGFRVSPMKWNGRDSYNRPVKQGIYFYKVNVKSNKGENSSLNGKMIIIR